MYTDFKDRSENEKNSDLIVGLIPAAGKGSRISPLPFSKELYPIAFRKQGETQDFQVKVVSHFLLEKMRKADILRAFVVIRDGKWDIPGYWKDGQLAKMGLSYLMMDLPFGVPYTIDQAYPFVRRSMIAFGFPDILFQPDDAFRSLIERQKETKADLVLGLFDAPNAEQTDVVTINPDGTVNAIQVNPGKTALQYDWILAFWTPDFTEFIHEFVTNSKKEFGREVRGSHLNLNEELLMAEVIQSAVEKGLHINSVVFTDQRWLDIGVPENLHKALQKFLDE